MSLSRNKGIHLQKHFVFQNPSSLFVLVLLPLSTVQDPVVVQGEGL
jgi:hypothetical protein